jgi:hypothetical protein
MPLVIKEVLHATHTRDAQPTLAHSVHEVAQSV